MYRMWISHLRAGFGTSLDYPESPGFIHGEVQSLFFMKKNYPEAKNPLILRYHRLMDAFAKADDERDFYMDTVEGFLLYVDLDKSAEDLAILEKELEANSARYILIPKMTFYEVKKFMEGFVHEKVYDIDTKEKLLDIIGSKEPRENFLEFIYDHLTELEKWQIFYQERSRIRIIEWLRDHEIHFVFEEDLDLHKNILEELKRNLFEEKVSRYVAQAREVLLTKSGTYYSSEALNPRPKRGRPPKQTAKVEIEPQFTVDIYTTVPNGLRQFLYIPDITSATSVTFSAKFETEGHLLASLKGTARIKVDEKLEALSQRLESLRILSDRLSGHEKELGIEKIKKPFQTFIPKPKIKKAKPLVEEEKLGAAVHEVLPRKRGKTGEFKEEFVPTRRKKFSIKKVTPIKTKKKKK